jgi:hypothetical protein
LILKFYARAGKAGDADPSALALIKSVPGTVSPESMLTEIGKSSRSTTELSRSKIGSAW